jgi:transcriptional repressor NrdR
MKCPYCGHEDTKVTDSRESDDGIRRRRECLSPECGRRFTTYERVQLAPLAVLKKDGRREEFSREKVLAGMRRSCAKLPVTGAEINALVDDIETALHGRGLAEVPSTEVGDLVMERLRELNHVAYVRFASHYRNFLSLEDLQEEFERLAIAPRHPPARNGAAQPPLLPPNELTKLSEPLASVQAAHRAPSPAAEPETVPEQQPPVPLEERRARRRAAP